MDISFFIYTFIIGRHLSFSCFLTDIVNNAAVNIHGQVFAWTCVCISWLYNSCISWVCSKFSKQYVNRELPDVQARCRKGRGTRDQIANIR